MLLNLLVSHLSRELVRPLRALLISSLLRHTVAVTPPTILTATIDQSAFALP